MLEKELETAIALARTASKRILEFYAFEIIAEEKFGVDNLSEPVTIADRTASKIIVEGLAEIFPDDAILSEEETDDIETRVSGKRVWMIDPIDGTWGFINKDGDFGVQIGLTDGGEAVLGVVFLPFHDELFYAVKGKGTFLVENGGELKRLQVSDKTDFSQMTLAVSRNHLSPKMARVSKDLHIGKVVHRGSVGLKVGLIARQTADLYIHLSPRTKYWDSCAPQIILEEAGGKMTDLFGAPLRYDLTDVQNHNGILASNGAAHDETINLIKSLLNEFKRFRLKNKRNTV
jgi:3'(2'), 5'-bisphosphate nucleotidase